MAGALHSGPELSGDSLGGYLPMAEINVTPFVDVMLVLLIIFMVAAPLMMVGVPLDLPKTDAARIAQTREPVVVSVDNSGKLFIGEDEVATDALVPRLSEIRQNDPDVLVYVRGDKAIDYGAVMKVLGQVGQAGSPKVSLIAEGDQVPAATPGEGR